MRTTLKTFACTVAVSIVLLACSDTGVNNPEQNLVSSSSYSSAEQQGNSISSSSSVLSSSSELLSSSSISSSSSYDIGDIPRPFLVIDLLAPKYEYDEAAYEAWFGGEKGGGICSHNTNGNKLYYSEEHNEWTEKYNKERAEKRRVSPMIGVFISNVYCLKDTDEWFAAMTAKEIVELKEKYEGLIIESTIGMGVDTCD